MAKAASSAAAQADMTTLSAYFSAPRLAAGVVSILDAAALWPLLLAPPVEAYRQITTPRDGPHVPRGLTLRVGASASGSSGQGWRG